MTTPVPEHVYFDLGEAVAAIAILLAIISLMRPRYEFRWALGIFRVTTARALFLFGISAVVIAAVLPYVHHPFLGIFSKTLTWEILATVALCVGAFGLLYQGNTAVKFSRWNYKEFYKVCHDWIVRANEDHLRALADEVGLSARNIVCYCRRESGRKPKKFPSVTSCAVSLFYLLSDKRFCAMCVTSCPGAGFRFIDEIQKQKLYNSAGFSFVKELVSQAFENYDSILYREERFSGLGHWGLFRDMVFGNYEFVSSEFRPLQAWDHRHRDHLTERSLDVYCDVLLIALEGYFKSGEFCERPSAMHVGFDVLAQCTGSFICDLAKMPKDSYSSEIFFGIYRIIEAFSRIFDLLQKNEARLPPSVTPLTRDDLDQDNSVYSSLAETIFEFIKKLSFDKKHDDFIRQCAKDLWCKLYPVSQQQETRSVVELQKRFEILFLQKINENLEKEHSCYPMIVRLAVSILGIHQTEGKTTGETRVRKAVISLLKSKLPGAATFERRIDDVLPDGYEYDVRTKKIVFKSRWAKEPMILECD